MTDETWGAITITFGIAKAWLIEHGVAIEEPDEKKLLNAIADRIALYGDDGVATDVIVALASGRALTVDGFLTALDEQIETRDRARRNNPPRGLVGLL